MIEAASHMKTWRKRESNRENSIFKGSKGRMSLMFAE